MENKPNISLIKKDELVKELAELETQVAAAKSKLHTVGNEEKMQNYRKSALEVKKDYLNRSIEFYKNKAQKLRHSLSKELAKHSQFSMADTYYNKLLEVYRESYLKNESPQTSSAETSDDVTRIHLDPQKQIEVLQKQIDDLEIRIVENSQVMKGLLDDLHSPSH